MADLIPTIVFYLFATVTVLSGVMVISSKNPVHSVFFLILAFFNSAGLFLLLGAEYLAMTLVIVYVGAVAVLFLFVVMMLNVDVAEMRKSFLKHLPLGLAVALAILGELLLVAYMAMRFPAALAPVRQAIPASAEIANTQAIGRVLYTWYLYPFQMAGIILLIAMIGAIVLTHRTRGGVRKQNVASQQRRKRADSIAVVKVKPREGIS